LLRDLEALDLDGAAEPASRNLELRIRDARQRRVGAPGHAEGVERAREGELRGGFGDGDVKPNLGRNEPRAERPVERRVLERLRNDELDVERVGTLDLEPHAKLVERADAPQRRARRGPAGRAQRRVERELRRVAAARLELRAP